MHYYFRNINEMKDDNSKKYIHLEKMVNGDEVWSGVRFPKSNLFFNNGCLLKVPYIFHPKRHIFPQKHQVYKIE